MRTEFYANKPLRMSKSFVTESTTLYCSIEDGVPAMEYFTFADLYSTYRVNLDYEDLKSISEFLENWDSEPVTIIQPYSTKVNESPSFCALKLEYVEKDEESSRTMQQITFYALCWGEDIESSLKEDKILSWSSWKDYHNWDAFEVFRTFVANMLRFFERSEESE